MFFERSAHRGVASFACALVVASAKEVSNETEEPTYRSTVYLSDEEVSSRKIFFSIVICGALFTLTVVALLLFAHKSGVLKSTVAPPRKEDSSKPLLLIDDEAVHTGDAVETTKLEDKSLPSLTGWADEPDLEALNRFALHEQSETMQLNAGFVRARWWILVSSFLVYVGVSIGVPYTHRFEATCSRGFFWETHMIYFGVFLATKIIEISLCALDPTITFKMSGTDFIMRFVPSFLGHSDGYLDATAIAIALSCDDPRGNQIGWYMLGVYAFGVVCLQWVVVSVVALRDPSHACLMKIVHMDLLASCVTLPIEHKSAWDWLHMARTFGEDLPQAALQSVYMLYVQQNYFMLVSVMFGVGSSLKAMYDAANRALSSVGANEKYKESQLPQYVVGGITHDLLDAAKHLFTPGKRFEFIGYTKEVPDPSDEFFESDLVHVAELKFHGRIDEAGRFTGEFVYNYESSGQWKTEKLEGTHEGHVIKCQGVAATGGLIPSMYEVQIKDGGLRLVSFISHPTYGCQKNVALLVNPAIPDPVEWCKENAFQKPALASAT